jgi:outer membrane PBP1 activator LpoA protein
MPSVRYGAPVETYEDTDPQLLAIAALEADGRFLDAAAELEEIAMQKGTPDQQKLLLRAGWDYFQAGQVDTARQLLEQVEVGNIPELRFRKGLLGSEIALLRNRGDEALLMLEQPPLKGMQDALRQRYHKNRAEAFRLTGNLLESARELSELDFYLTEPEARLDNQWAIVQTLSMLTDTALDLLQPKPPGIYGGWMQLARVIKARETDPEGAQPLLDRWREHFPSHPALPALIEEHYQRVKSHHVSHGHLAVLLPAGGPYAKAAAALRAGIMAAYFSQPAEKRPQIHFYDSTNTDETWPLYRDAVDGGAEMIIGPLSKDAVAQLARAGWLDTPVLALNQVPPDTTPPSNLYQFGLAPEDDARQAAERAWVDGHTQALVLIPEGDWGERIRQAFSDRWEQLGGRLAESQTYNAKEHDFSAPIQALLNVDESKQRRNALKRTLGTKLEFEPRRRQDADFIFLAAKAQSAREIRPQLQFHHASDLPLYTTSHSYSGKPNPRKDLDLEGIRFPDIPWLLLAEGSKPLSKERLGKIFPQSKTSHRRLYAMGIDSYRLLPHLQRLQSSSRESLDGETGILFLDGLNYVHRQLVWAEMKRGEPKVLGYATRIESDSDRGFGRSRGSGTRGGGGGGGISGW